MSYKEIKIKMWWLDDATMIDVTEQMQADIMAHKDNGLRFEVSNEVWTHLTANIDSCEKSNFIYKPLSRGLFNSFRVDINHKLEGLAYYRVTKANTNEQNTITEPPRASVY